MKQILSLLLVTGLSCAVTAQEETPFLTRSLTNDAIEQVQAETSGGHITVTGGTEAKILVYVRSDNGRQFTLSKEEIQRKLDEDYDFSITTANHKLTAIARPKIRPGHKWNNGLSVSFDIFVPENVSTNLATSGGHIKLTRLAGTQDFKTSGGHLRLDGLSGKIKGHTSGGHIEVSNSKDDITLITSGGHVEATNCQGKIKLTTSGGHLKLQDLSGNIDATTSGGHIRGGNISGDLLTGTSGGNINLDNLSCSLTASTSGGNIDITMKELGSFVKLTNSGGHVNLQIPANKGIDLNLKGDKVKVTTLANFSGDIEDDHIEGKLNGGGIPITVRGSSGRVTLTLK